MDEKEMERQFNIACKIIAILAIQAGGEIRIKPEVAMENMDGKLTTATDPATGDLVIQYKPGKPSETPAEPPKEDE